MTGRAVAVRLVVGAVLLAGTAGSGPGGSERHQRDLDVIASAQPSDLHPARRDVVTDESVVDNSDVRADLVATSSTTCHGCVGESSGLQVLYLTRAQEARLGNVATAWTQDCWDCSATALAVQVVVLPGRPRAEPINRSFAVSEACATCRSAAAAFQVVVSLDPVTRLPQQALDELRAWFAGQEAALRAAVTGPVLPRANRRAARAAAVAVAELRDLATAGRGSRVWSARAHVSR